MTYGPNDELPPLPESNGWDPSLRDADLLRTSEERKATRDDHLDVTSTLEAAFIPCCVVGVAALQHFGAKRVSDVSPSTFYLFAALSVQ